MGCTSSREHVKIDNKAKEKLVAPELLSEGYLTSSYIHTNGRLALYRPSSISDAKEIFPQTHASSRNHKPEKTRCPRRSEETVANFVRENKSTLPKIREISESKKLSNEPEVIDVGELMAGLEAAANPFYSSRTQQTNKAQTAHNRSMSLSVCPSFQNSKLSADLGSPDLRHPVSRPFHQRAMSLSPVGVNYEPKSFSVGQDSGGDGGETVCKDVVTVIKEVIGSPADIRSSSEGMIRKKLFDVSPAGGEDPSKGCNTDSDKLRKSEVLSEQINFPTKATNQKSHGSKTCSVPSFDLISSTGNMLRDDDMLCEDAMDEFSLNSQIFQKVTGNTHYDLEDDVDLEKKELGTLFKHTIPVGGSIWLPSIPLQRVNSVNLNDFEKLVPPRGENRVVLYTTSSYRNWKTFEECSLARKILHSYKIDLDERDILLHPELNFELQQIMKRAYIFSVPRLFIKGRHIGGVEEVCLLHKAKALERLLQVFSSEYIKALCVCCGGNRTIQCLGCNGMCWLKTDENDVIPCHECEKKGWIMCPICS